MMKLPGLFVVGTDTGVGKTTIAGAIVARLTTNQHRVGVLKPVATGARRDDKGELRSDDVEALKRAVGMEVPSERVCPLLYEEPLAPSVAARRQGQPLHDSELGARIEEALDWWSSRADLMIVEGVGGLYCPLTEESVIADLAVALDFPILIVARRGLGTLNHTLMTVELALQRSLRIAGILLNDSEDSSVIGDPARATNAEELSRRIGSIPILAEVGFGAVGPDAPWLKLVEWSGLALRPRRERSLAR